MRLKTLTTALLIAGIVLMLGWPFIVGQTPKKEAPRHTKVVWMRRALAYFAVTSGVWLSAATSAYLLSRRTRLEFMESERQMLQGLVEGTLQDHGKRS